MASDIAWQKSSFSGGGEGNNCVELTAGRAGTIVLRESHSPHEVITTSPGALSDLICHLKSA